MSDFMWEALFFVVWELEWISELNYLEGGAVKLVGNTTSLKPETNL